MGSKEETVVEIERLSRMIETAVESAPDLYMQRGKLFYLLGEYHSAKNDFIRADELSGGDDEARSYIDMISEIFEFRNLDMYNP